MDWNRVGVLRRLFGGGDWELPVTADGRDPGIQAQYREALRSSKGASMWDVPLHEIRYVVVDTETTGFVSATDSLLSLAAVEVQGSRITGVFQHSFSALPEGQQIPSLVTELTGIVLENLIGAPQPEEVVQNFLKFLNGDVLIAHHARHDVSFINHYLRRMGLNEIENRVLDTANIFKWVQGIAHIPPLEEVMNHYQISMDGRHTALGDAGLTARVWQKLMVDVQSKGVVSLGDLIESLLTH